MTPGQLQYLSLLSDFESSGDKAKLEESNKVFNELPIEERHDLDVFLYSVQSKPEPYSPKRECNQCGTKEFPGWGSWQCPSFPFGSCDGIMVDINGKANEETVDGVVGNS